MEQGKAPYEYDQLLLNMPDESFYRVVQNTLQLFRDAQHEGHLLLLSSELANTSLVTKILPTQGGDTLLRWQAMCYLLRWSIAALKPSTTDASSSLDERWYAFMALHRLYDLGATMEKTAEELAISLAKLRSLRDDATRMAAKNLRMALSGKVGVGILHAGFVETLYHDGSPAEREVMEFLAVLRTPIDRDELVGHTGVQGDDTIATLMHQGLVVAEEETGKLSLVEALRQPIRTAMPLANITQWNQVAAEMATQRRDFIEAAHHWLHAGEPVAAARLLVAEYEPIVDAGDIEAIYSLARTLIDGGISELYVHLLHITSGQAAMRIADVSTALHWYRGVMSADDICLRAYAMYLSGKAAQAIAVAESQRYFERGIELLSSVDSTCVVLETIRPDLSRETLLFDLYLGLAWLYIQEMPDFPNAKAHLQQAAAVLPVEDRRRETDLHNGWAGYFKEVKDEAQVLNHRLSAWVAAQETGSADLQIMTVHNLGQACIWNRQFERGAHYVQMAIDLAVQIGDRQREGKCRQTMGVGCFFQNRFDEAVVYYRESLDIFRETGNLNWVAWAHHDLAEAYGEMSEFSAGRAHILESQALAPQLGSGQLTAALAKLYRTYPGLRFDLSDSESAVLAYVRTYGAITNRACVTELDVSSRTANRLLNRLVKAGLLKKIGQGRSVRYVLVGGNEFSER